jgi:hypothetical protein
LAQSGDRIRALVFAAQDNLEREDTWYGIPLRQKEWPRIKQIKICNSSTLRLSGLPGFI